MESGITGCCFNASCQRSLSCHSGKRTGPAQCKRGQNRLGDGGGRDLTHDKAEGEPGMRLDDMARVVAAVVAPADDALVPLDFLAEGVLAKGENEAHGRLVGQPRLGPGRRKRLRRRVRAEREIEIVKWLVPRCLVLL